jgi:hypothetical protein
MQTKNPNIFATSLITEHVPALATAEKVLSFGSLRPGWHYGEGVAPKQKAIEAALTIFWQFYFAGFEDTDAFPGIDGEIMVTAYHGDHYLEVLVETDGTMNFSYEFAGEDALLPASERRPAAAIKEKIEEIAREIWSTSGSYIATTLTPDPHKTASRVWHSKTPQTMEEHPWYSSLVLMQPAIPFVTMQGNIIRQE